MPINVNSVYEAVLDIANKEQRGYITPKEFNVFANHAQNEIFTSYFAKSNIHGQAPPNDSEYADPHDISQEKIEYFEVDVHAQELRVLSEEDDIKNIFALITPADFYKIQNVMVRYDTTQEDHKPDDNKKVKTTHFGLKNPKIGAFPDHNNEQLKSNYLKRHRPRENWSDMFSAGALSRWILWDKKTIKESIKAFKKRFNLK